MARAFHAESVNQHLSNTAMRKIIGISTVIAAVLLTVAVAPAHSAPQTVKVAPPLPPGLQGPNPFAQTPEAQKLAAQISDYATAQCGGKDAVGAPDCRIKILWAATQCPDRVTQTPADKTQSDSRPCVVPDGGFEYEVSSIKPHKDEGQNSFSTVGNTADGYHATNMNMRNAVMNAYAAGMQIEITGTPSWFDDARFDVEAKYVPEVADAIKKLTPADRGFVQRYMMQQLLKERTHLAVRIETKEVPSYDLVVGKNGPKLKEADPNAKDNGTMRMMMDQGKMVMTAKGMQMSNFARNLAGSAGRPVFDKTGLTGRYDVTMEYSREQNLSATVPNASPTGSAPAPAPDPIGPSVFDSVEALGLKLVPSRGPMMVVVIEHMEKPDAN
jgi:uncharacterized protein (TIGR03435 family)